MSNQKTQNLIVYTILAFIPLGIAGIVGYRYFIDEDGIYKRALKYLIESNAHKCNKDAIKTWEKGYVNALYKGLKKNQETIEYKGKKYSTKTCKAV